MNQRTKLLKEIIYIKRDLLELQAELSKYPWDVDTPLVIITKQDFLNIINKCIKKEITFNDIEIWSNIIECREDVEWEQEEMQEIIFELANPEINGAIDNEKLHDVIKQLDMMG